MKQKELTIVAVNFQQRWVFFAGFSIKILQALFACIPAPTRAVRVSFHKIRPFNMQ